MTKPVKNKGLQKGKTNNPNGRPLGVPNKRTQEALEIFGKFEFCPLEKILDRLKKHGETMDEELYLNTCVKLMKFKFPERKAIEHKFDPKDLDDKTLIEETRILLAEVEGV